MLSRILSGGALMIALFGASAGRASDENYNKSGRPARAEKPCSCAKHHAAAKSINPGSLAAPAEERFQDSYHNDPAKMN